MWGHYSAYLDCRGHPAMYQWLSIPSAFISRTPWVNCASVSWVNHLFCRLVQIEFLRHFVDRQLAEVEISRDEKVRIEILTS